MIYYYLSERDADKIKKKDLKKVLTKFEKLGKINKSKK